MKFLDEEGVKTLWSAVKNKVAAVNKTSVGLGNVSNDAQVKRSEMGKANGVPTLDSNGRIPLDQLGNLDTTVAEVVTALPTTNIKKHIYMIKSAETTDQNIYKEYIYTGDTSATYNASNWEELGEYKSEVDLTPYSKKADTIKTIVSHNYDSDVTLSITKADNDTESVIITPATATVSGVMTPTDKKNLDKLVAGSVEWDSIKNKPSVAILAGNENYSNDDAIAFADDSNNMTVINSTAITIADLTTNSQKSISILKDGIILSVDGESIEGSTFMTDGTTVELTSISEDELNTILV